MPKLTPKDYAAALYDAVTETSPKDHDVIMDRFVKILTENGDLGKYEAIEKEYKLLEMKAKGITEAEVTVAREVELNSRLVHQLNEIIKGKVEVKKKIDNGIVGGIVVRVDDTLIDASLKTQLNDLNKSLKN